MHTGRFSLHQVSAARSTLLHAAGVGQALAESASRRFRAGQTPVQHHIAVLALGLSTQCSITRLSWLHCFDRICWALRGCSRSTAWAAVM